ncbi:MAG: sigma-70 family RNA polymerase sigma factor [Burkholderiaceae bacterium]
MPGAAAFDEETDASAMLRFAGGDADAFDLLYARHGLAVWRYLLRHVRDAALADDLLQDVWFAVARQGARYQPTARFRTWLFTMAHNRMVDHWRTFRSHLSLDGGAEEGGLADSLAADSGWGPLRQLQSREQGTALLVAIERLPIEQREAFLLQAEAGMSVQEIAQATGVGFEAAKSRLRYARHSLRQSLKEFA